MANMQERLAVLSMNIFCRPEGIHSGTWFQSGDHKDLRLALLLRKMARFDVVILQEMFEAGPRHRRFVREARRLGFHYHCGSVWPQLLDSRLIDGGLLILSRFPIVERDQIAFSVGAGSDGICAKGVLYARIQLSPDLADSLHVFTTHTQAGDNHKEFSIRAAQLRELQRFVGRTIREDAGVPVLITGDFNLDARHNLVHDERSGASTASRCQESHVYQQLVADLERVVRQTRLESELDDDETAKDARTTLVDLMKRCDSTKLAHELHPITNGDGHATLVHTSDPLSPQKDGKCIDYMFFFPGVGERERERAVSFEATSTTTATSTDSTDGDDAVMSATTPRFSLRLVDEHTRVDHASVQELISDEDDEDEKHRLPITHLSDHYALRAEFTLKTTQVTRPDGRPVGSHETLASLLQLYFPQQAFAQQPRRLWKWKLALALLAIVGAVGGVALSLARGVLLLMA